MCIAFWVTAESSLQRARKEHAEMKRRRKSKARDPKLKGDELDDLAQQAADEASTPFSHALC